MKFGHIKWGRKHIYRSTGASFKLCGLEIGHLASVFWGLWRFSAALEWKKPPKQLEPKSASRIFKYIFMQITVLTDN